MGTLPQRFGLTLANIPLWNLRNEFITYRSLLSQPEFRSQFNATSPKPIDSPYVSWYGMPDSFLTLLLQRAILGVEAYVSGAVFFEVGARGGLSREVLDYIRNPFLLRGRGTADNVYNRLPAVLDKQITLENADPPLWQITQEFYSTIRNPLFHGYELTGSSPEAVAGAYEQMAKLHMWIDSWHDPDKLFKQADEGTVRNPPDSERDV